MFPYFPIYSDPVSVWGDLKVIKEKYIHIYIHITWYPKVERIEVLNILNPESLFCVYERAIRCSNTTYAVNEYLI